MTIDLRGHATCSELQHAAAESQQRLAEEVVAVGLSAASEIIAYLARQPYPSVLSIVREDWDDTRWSRGMTAPLQINYRSGRQLAGAPSPIGEYVLDVAVRGDVLFRSRDD